MNAITKASATQVAKLIRFKEISSEQVVRSYLERIASVNPRLNAVVHITADSAIAAARRADRLLARGEIAGPLHGVPMTIKDAFDTAGVVSTWGTRGRTGFVPAEDATVVKRVKAAGAILLGKTNTPELTLSFETDNPIHGRTSNPYDLGRMPGGSSGGAAAIIAAGGSPFDIGSDTGGSIRLPAHFCGIAGIKPTSGRVPRTGLCIPPGGLLDFLTHVGPMARYVEDLMLILPIIAGPDGRDTSIAPIAVGDEQQIQPEGLRAAYHTDNGIAAATPETAAAVEMAAQALGSAGIEAEAYRPDGIEETLNLFMNLMQGWDGGAWVRMLLEQAGTSIAESTLQYMLHAPVLPPDGLVRLIARLDRFRSRMLRVFDAYDLIVSPANAYPALKNGELNQKFSGCSYTMTYNLTGWPAVVVRAGTSSAGLPIGVQIIARPWRDDVALAAAQWIETALGGWRPPEMES